MKALLSTIANLPLSDSMKTILILASIFAMAKAPKPSSPAPSSVAVSDNRRAIMTDAEAVLRVAAGEIGVREATGNNDGARVMAYLKSTGNVKGEPYCASFVHWCGLTALKERNPYPRSASSVAQVKGGTRDVTTARPGATFGVWSSSKGRVAHTGLVEKRQGNFLVTIEGNTSNAAALGSAEDREAGAGGGVYRKRRPVSTIYNVKNYFP
jgi:hypothetical protein